MTAASHRPLGLRGWLKHGGVVLLITLIVTFLHHAGWFTCFETATLDAFLTLNKRTQESADVVLITITDEDYAELFNATSPLKAETVQRLLATLATLPAARPRAIGVDLDTSAPSWQGYRPPSEAPPVVWAREAAIEQGHVDLQPFLGEPHPTGARWGVAAAPLDADGVIRRYRWTYSLSEETVPSFAAAVLDAAGDHTSEHEPSGQLHLNFFGDRYRFASYSAADALRLAGSPDWQRSLCDRIVLIGATFRQSRDEYRAPWDGKDGRWYGVEVMANVIETELRGQGVRPVNHLWMVLLDILCGLAIVALNHRFSVGKALFWSLALAVVAAPASSFLTFSSFAYWASFVPVMVGVAVHQLYDHAVEYRKLLQKEVSVPKSPKPRRRPLRTFFEAVPRSSERGYRRRWGGG